MKIKKGRLFMIALLSAMMAFSLFGCKKEEPISGGTTDNSDPDAPKVIESKDIESLSAHFYLDLRHSAKGDHLFDFEIGRDENGVLKASEKNSGISFEADKQLLGSLQELIDRYELVKLNGENRVTAGLPPEFQPCYLEVEYTSKERLYFRHDNDPMAKWAQGFYDIFAKWFENKGDGSLYPEKETSPLERIDIMIKENDIYYYCQGTNVEDSEMINGEKYLLNRSIWDDAKKESLFDKLIPFPQDYYEKITEILDRYDTLRRYDFSYFDHGDGFYGFNEDPDGEETDGNDKIDLYIRYESGKTLNIETGKASEIKAMSGLLNDLRSYCDSLFE